MSLEDFELRLNQVILSLTLETVHDIMVLKHRAI